MKLAYLLFFLLANGIAVAQSEAPIIVTVAGATNYGEAPKRGYDPDETTARLARLTLASRENECDRNPWEQVSHLAFDNDGNLYFSDTANLRVRRITPGGVLSTVAGNGTRPPIDFFFCAVLTGAAVGDGNQATNAAVFNPAGLAFLTDGSLIIVDQHSNRIRRVAPTGVISTIVGGMHSFYAPGIPATSSGLDWPTAVAVGPDGLVYFTELHSGRVARVNADGRLATIVGTGFSGFNLESGPATSVRLWNPTGITFDRQGNLYIADQTNHRVRRVTPDGNLTTIAGTSAGAGFSGDGGPATSAQLNRPTDVKVDRAGNIYISDMSNHRVRRIDPQGIITTLAGDGEPGRGPDGVPASTSSLNMPTGLALDANDRLYIVDWGNYLIRRVSTNGEPAIRSAGVVNAASFAAGPIAPGSLISIVGSTLTSGDTLEVRLGDQPATITFRSAEQINAALPYGIAPGPAPIRVTSARGVSAPEFVTIAPAAIGVFHDPVSRQAIALNQDGSLNSPERPESAGRVLTIFATGIGEVIRAADGLDRSVADVTARLGERPATLLFAGLTPGFLGLAQFNILVPDGVTAGSAVPLTLISTGQTSNPTVVAVR